MKTNPCVVILLTILLASCGPKDRLSKVWLYTHSTGPVKGDDTLLSPVSFLALRPDGSFTRDFGTFEYGAWNLKDGQLNLQPHNGKALQLKFSINGKEMLLRASGGTLANFEGKPLPQKTEDPFANEHNQWRIPATRKETDKEIRARLHNHCKFWEAYFTWALKNEFSTIDVRSTPTPIKIYGNGFAVKPFNELPAAWTSYFFDEEDCRKANNELTNTFRQHDIAWAKTDNKYKMFISAFQQLQRHLD